MFTQRFVGAKPAYCFSSLVCDKENAPALVFIETMCVFFSVRDGKVRKSVERIFSIWEERNVYPEEVIAQFKASLHKKDKEREKQKEKEKEKQKEKETPSNNGQLSF